MPPKRSTPKPAPLESSGSSGARTVGNSGRAGNGANNDGGTEPTPEDQLVQGGNNNTQGSGQEHAESARGTPEEETPEQEALAARHARLKLQLAAHRQRQEIAEMERELAGGEPAYSVLIDGAAPVRGHKRIVSDTAEMPSSVHRKLAAPPTYAGKNISELRLYDAGWKTQFAAMPPLPTEESRVLLAAISLREEAVIE
jgi:hypothetical protein